MVTKFVCFITVDSSTDFRQEFDQHRFSYKAACWRVEVGLMRENRALEVARSDRKGLSLQFISTFLLHCSLHTLLFQFPLHLSQIPNFIDSSPLSLIPWPITINSSKSRRSSSNPPPIRPPPEPVTRSEGSQRRRFNLLDRPVQASPSCPSTSDPQPPPRHPAQSTVVGPSEAPPPPTSTTRNLSSTS